MGKLLWLAPFTNWRGSIKTGTLGETTCLNLLVNTYLAMNQTHLVLWNIRWKLCNPESTANEYRYHGKAS